MQDHRVDPLAAETPDDGVDERLPYVAPTLTTVESKLMALLGSGCPPDPAQGGAPDA